MFTPSLNLGIADLMDIFVAAIWLYTATAFLKQTRAEFTFVESLF